MREPRPTKVASTKIPPLPRQPPDEQPNVPATGKDTRLLRMPNHAAGHFIKREQGSLHLM